MKDSFVQVLVDVHCKWEDQEPIYRVYVGNELFTERTWIWQNVYLEENIPILATNGVYTIRFETVDPESGRIKVRNHRVVTGPGKIIDYQGHTAVEISDALE